MPNSATMSVSMSSTSTEYFAGGRMQKVSRAKRRFTEQEFGRIAYPDFDSGVGRLRDTYREKISREVERRFGSNLLGRVPVYGA